MNRAGSTKSKFALIFLVSVMVSAGSVLFILLHHEDGDYRVVFELQDTDGRSVSEASLKGQWSVLVFGFTHCPDICPNQVFTIAESLKLLDQQVPSNGVQAIFISVDYLRDSAEHLDKYLTYFHPRFVGLLGSKLQLDLTVDAFDASYSVSELENSRSDIMVTHSSSIYLIDPDGRIAKQLPFETSAENLASTLLSLYDSE